MTHKEMAIATASLLTTLLDLPTHTGGKTIIMMALGERTPWLGNAENFLRFCDGLEKVGLVTSTVGELRLTDKGTTAAEKLEEALRGK